MSRMRLQSSFDVKCTTLQNKYLTDFAENQSFIFYTYSTFHLYFYGCREVSVSIVQQYALTPEEFLKTSGVICKIIQKGVNFTITPEVSADSSGVIHMSLQEAERRGNL